MMKINFKLIISALVLFSFFACEPYEEYRYDYDYSAIYFGSQKPLRTLVARENKSTLEFKLGVTLAGMIENNKDQWATFEIAPDLLTTVEGAGVFTLLPADWYEFSISENKITIPKGKFLGDFTIRIDNAKFTADPLSLTKTYVLPVRLTASSADSLLTGTKDYTVLVVKYINEYSGTYYVRGEQIELDALGAEIDGTKKTYYQVDWSQNTTRIATTKSLNTCEMKGVGSEVSETMTLTFGASNSVMLSAPAALSLADMGCSYSGGVYSFNYTYKKGGKTYQVKETLKQRNDPETELRYEEW